MEAAITRLDAAAAAGTSLEMVLQSALGFSDMFTLGISSRARAALTRASELAESLGDADYQLRALVGLSTFCQRLEEFQDALALGRRAEAIAKGVANPVAISVADCMLGAPLLFLGEYAQALIHAQRVHRRVTPIVRRSHIVRTGLDYSVEAGCVMALVYWQQGLLDRSVQITRDVLADAQTGGHPVSLAFALTWSACPISLRLGDMEAAERSIALLKDHARRHGLKSHHFCGLGYEGQLSASRGDIVAAERLLRACLDGLHDTQFEILYTAFLSGLAEVLAMAGRPNEGLAAADEAVQRTERHNAFWWMPEALRIKGEILLQHGSERALEAANCFDQAAAMAREQGALSWELRIGLSLCRLRVTQGRGDEGRWELARLYDRFTEGFGTADLIAAKQLLDAVDNAGRD
jgi:tetratricopeptide (TPR) repeat protein